MLITVMGYVLKSKDIAFHLAVEYDFVLASGEVSMYLMICALLINSLFYGVLTETVRSPAIFR